MYKMKSRIYDGSNQLIGYEVVSHTGKSSRVSRRTAWTMAKNKKILDVTASGSIENTVLSGTNGFEIKRLPRITIDMAIAAAKGCNVDGTAVKRFRQQDFISAAIRMILNGYVPSADEYNEVKCKCTAYLSEEIKSGKLSMNKLRSESMNFEVVAALYDENEVRTAKNNNNASNEERMRFERDRNTRISDAMHMSQKIYNNNIDIDAMALVIGASGVTEESISKLEKYVDENIKLTAELTMSKEDEISKFVNVHNSIKRLKAGAGTLDIKVASKEADKIAKRMHRTDAIASDACTNVMYGTFNSCRTPASERHIIGYRLIYSGDKPKTITRVRAKDRLFVEVAIQPGQEINLSKIEFALLAGRPEIGGTFSNCKVAERSLRKMSECKDRYEALSACEIAEQLARVRIHYTEETDKHFNLKRQAINMTEEYLDKRAEKMKQRITGDRK